MKNNRRFLAAPTLSLFLILSFLVSAVPAQSSIADRKSLNEKFTEVVSREILNRGSLGVKIAKLEGGEVIFEHNAEKYFMPASNMKSFTVSTALETFGPEFRFITSFYAPALPDKKGKIKGDLIVYGRGDVSISPLFHDGDLMKGIDQVTDKLIASGIKKIEGNIVADDSFFIGDAIPSSWEYDDLTSYYGAEVSSLPINDNAVDMTIKPSSPGKPCIIEIKPALTLLGVANNCITSEPQTPRRMQFQKSVEASRVTVAGSIASDDAGFTRSVAIHRPGLAYVDLLKQSLERKGINIKGRAMVIYEKAQRFRSVEIARY
jgi:D-alanyl-D-alanine carboxypeptidase/D-alanyl-D-alanine-endopeptidase (penicillin-binding protein 4)